MITPPLNLAELEKDPANISDADVVVLISVVRKTMAALELAAKNVTWVAKATDGSDVLHTYGHHVEHCQQALTAIRSLVK